MPGRSYAATMFYNTLTTTFTLNGLLDSFKVLVDKIQTLRNKLPLPQDDARHVGLFGMQEAVIGFGLTAHSIAGNGLRSRQRSREEVLESFANYVTIEGRTPEQLLAMVESVWRLGLLTIFHFRLDALFQNLLTALGCNPGTKRGQVLNYQLLTAILRSWLDPCGSCIPARSTM